LPVPGLAVECSSPPVALLVVIAAGDLLLDIAIACSRTANTRMVPFRMDGLDLSPGTLTAAVIALSFAAGLNLYATILALGAMARLHWVVLPTGLEALASPWIIGASALLFAGEFVADKIPGFDLIWNALHTFIRIPVAALLAYGAASHLSPVMHLLVTCLGALIATIAHSSKTAARIAVTPSPEPISNIALSTAEDGVAIGLSWVALHHPVAGSLVVACFIAATLGAAWWGARRLHAGWLKTRARWSRDPQVRVVR
jgi:hypothetical protein